MWKSKQGLCEFVSKCCLSVIHLTRASGSSVMTHQSHPCPSSALLPLSCHNPRSARCSLCPAPLAPGLAQQCNRTAAARRASRVVACNGKSVGESVGESVGGNIGSIERMGTVVKLPPAPLDTSSGTLLLLAERSSGSCCREIVPSSLPVPSNWEAFRVDSWALPVAVTSRGRRILKPSQAELSSQRTKNGLSTR